MSAKVPKKGKRGKCLVVLEYGTVFYLHGMGTGDVGTVLNYRYGNG